MADCTPLTIDFIARVGDTGMLAVEEELVADLAKIGITLNVRYLSSANYTAAEVNGDYNMLFSRTWGAPYDPHSYLNSWAVPSHVENSAITGLEAPLTKEALLDKIFAVQQEFDPAKIQAQWHDILDDIHQQAIFLPLWGSRTPYVINRRLTGFQPSDQAFTYPLEGIRIKSGSAKVTIAPGVNGALFKSIGPLNPHQYFPNQIFSSTWVYEGLVSYGQDGEIVPALATSWTTVNTGTGQRVTFQLRQGVEFHDGSEWNCTVAKLNFDHILSDIVRPRHAWFGTGKFLKSWTCNSKWEFVLETSKPFYPLLQELTYSRPLVFASANAFSQGIYSDPTLHNSCQSGDFGSKWNFLEENVTCLGLSAPVGTGPFRYVNRTLLVENSDIDAGDKKVLFARHDKYWAGAPAIEFLEIVHFGSTDDVEAALRDGTLDMALGAGPLTAQQVQSLKFYDSDKFDVRHSQVLQNVLAVMNTGRAPTNNIKTRQAIIHAVNKAVFIEKEFLGLEQPVSELLPLSAPFSNVDLSPKWSYDLEKAKLLNCPSSLTAAATPASDGLVAGLVVAGCVVAGLFILVIRMIVRERQGKPIFLPLAVEEPTQGKGPKGIELPSL